MRFLLFVLLLATTAAFLNNGKSAKLFRIKSEIKASDAPSDTSYDAALSNVKSPKSALMGDSSLSRSELNELILELEKKNPTSNPANSDKLNGLWELTTSTGFTVPGLILYQVLKSIPGGVIDASSVSIRISSESPRVKASASIKVGGVFSTDVSVVSDISAVSGARLSEEYKSGTISTVEVPLSFAQSL